MTQLALPLPVKRRPGRPSEPILRSASIDVVGDVTYRWTATRGWGSGPTILWTLLNPSVADDRRDDPTMLRMMGFSFRWGFGSMVVTNLEPFVSSTTPRLRAWRKTLNHQAWWDAGAQPWSIDKSPWSARVHNFRTIRNLIKPDTVCVAAWGAGADPEEVDAVRLFERRLEPDEEDFDGFGKAPVIWHCLGKTKEGHPVHPLARGKHRVPDDRKLQIWSRG
jgi:hypothetical protein